MIRTIVGHEWRLLRRDAAATWAGVLLIATSVYAMASGFAWQQSRSQEVLTTVEESSASLAQLRVSAAGGETQVGSLRTYAPLPTGPLAAFSIGLADLVPERAEVSVWRRQDSLFQRYQLDSPLTLLSGRFDLTFVVLYLMPLWILALSYNMLSAEREGGTLPLVLMQPLTLFRLLFAKLVTRLLLLTAYFLFLGTAGVALLGVDSTAYARLLGWLSIGWLYGLFWLAVAALTGSLVRRSETCAAAMISAWLLVVIVLPGLLNVMVQWTSPVPSRLAFVTAMRSASNEAAKESAELLAQYYHEHPELGANGQQAGFMPAYYASQREVERLLDPVLQDYEQRLVRQQSLVERWRFVSPAITAQEALIELAGSGLGRQRRIAAQAGQFLDDWHQTLSPLIFLGKTLQPEDFDRLPSFQFTEPSVSSGRFAASLIAIALPACLAMVLARWRLRRNRSLT